MKCSLGISNFLEEISSLAHSILFFYFFALITEEGFLISPCYFLNSALKWVYSLFFLASLFTAICEASSDNHLAFLHVFFLGMFLITGSYVMNHSSSGTLSIKINPFLSISPFDCKIAMYLIYVIPEWSIGFPYFLQFKSEFSNKEFMSRATVSCQSYFC